MNVFYQFKHKQNFYGVKCKVVLMKKNRLYNHIYFDYHNYFHVIEQADTMDYMVGFPDFIMDDEKLNEKHQLVSVN